jgi:hypothetical protein
MSMRERLIITGGMAAGVLAMVTFGGAANTYAGFSDFAQRHATVGAGVWAPDPPTECGALSTYPGGVVYGTPGDDELFGGNQSQVIMGLGGDDVIHGNNSGDCLVGGDGNDRLYGGNAKDVLIGDNGDDSLDGGNGADFLDGGGGDDDCLGGNGPDTLRDCEDTVPVAPSTLMQLQAQPSTATAKTQTDSSNEVPATPAQTEAATPTGTATDTPVDAPTEAPADTRTSEPSDTTTAPQDEATTTLP